MVKLFGKIELTFGLLLITYASYLMMEFTINPDNDPHGFVLMIALFGAGIGGLMSFSGSVYLFAKKTSIDCSISVNNLYSHCAVHIFFCLCLKKS